MPTPRFKAAVVQAEPVWLDVHASTDKAIGLIAQAARNGAGLIAFPETWIPGYPAWIWSGSPLWGMKFIPRYYENSIVVGDEPFTRLAKAAAEHGITAVVGASERDGGSLYMAQFIFGAHGEVIATRRKLKPTSVERSVFGEGDGSDLAVHEVEGIGRLGALNCWEHLQPLTKYAMYSMNEQVHVASWPSLAKSRYSYPLSDEASMRISQVYALEGGCYVLAATTMLGERGLDMFAEGNEERVHFLSGGSGGFSQIFAPDGRPVGTTLPPDVEGLVYGEIDLGVIPLVKSLQDPAGHYSRGDVTRLLFDPRPRTPVVRAPLTAGARSSCDQAGVEWDIDEQRPPAEPAAEPLALPAVHRDASP
ncbi:carbon-nitrogen hydrolase family protein [Actinoallomurus iriomotensis]|uniref:Nitrilase n=1 Tax=Actinoallomurus iriomotensis TaxID=478107 RepID=A0A9W6RX80_9ACTN|nr:carbon-nitrogen hydrolase family protein [Actinoallomurus iriomotensis]GLY83328.1 nitrilase [Actinoallomurus iriomotensis]